MILSIPTKKRCLMFPVITLNHPHSKYKVENTNLTHSNNQQGLVSSRSGKASLLNAAKWYSKISQETVELQHIPNSLRCFHQIPRLCHFKPWLLKGEYGDTENLPQMSAQINSMATTQHFGTTPMCLGILNLKQTLSKIKTSWRSHYSTWE